MATNAAHCDLFRYFCKRSLCSEPKRPSQSKLNIAFAGESECENTANEKQTTQATAEYIAKISAAQH